MTKILKLLSKTVDLFNRRSHGTIF